MSNVSDDMTWQQYYDNYSDWENKTQINRIAQLTNFGEPDEICEVADALCDETGATRLIAKALAAHVVFSAGNITLLIGLVTSDCLDSVVTASKCQFTKEQLEELDGCISYDVLEATAKRCHIDLYDDEAELQEIEQLKELNQRERCDRVPQMGAFGKITVMIGMANEEKSKKDDSHCNGDYAHCPPHYGYRYGRWYYGHHHTRGCERGGNKGL